MNYFRHLFKEPWQMCVLSFYGVMH